MVYGCNDGLYNKDLTPVIKKILNTINFLKFVFMSFKIIGTKYYRQKLFSFTSKN